MPVWFGGKLETGQEFEITRSEDKPYTYSATVGTKLFNVTEDFERQTLEPYRATQCFRIDTGLFLFPWRWGHDNSVWPRFEPRGGGVQLIDLKVERGSELPKINGHATMMASIKNLLVKDRKRFDRERLRTNK
jgi:hypothetical protein